MVVLGVLLHSFHEEFKLLLKIDLELVVKFRVNLRGFRVLNAVAFVIVATNALQSLVTFPPILKWTENEHAYTASLSATVVDTPNALPGACQVDWVVALVIRSSVNV